MAAASIKSNNNKISLAMERTGQWVFSQDIPTDVVVAVGEVGFNLHKFMLVAKSNYIRKLILESKAPDLARIDLSDIPGGVEIFEKAAKFCYGVNFEITVHNVAALRCAADYLQMTDKYSDGNLAGRTEDFLSQAALTSLSGAVVVLKSCEDLLPVAEDLKIVQRCVDVATVKACNEANFPSRSPPNWWTEELSILPLPFFEKIIQAMKSRGAKPLTLATAIVTYAERSLASISPQHLSPAPLRQQSLNPAHKQLLESIVKLLPSDKTALPINFLCRLLRTGTLLRASPGSKAELEKRVSAVMEHATVDDLLVLSFTSDGESLLDLESVRRVVSGFVEKEKSVAVFNAGDFEEVCSAAMQRVAKTVDAYLGEVATCGELSISKFNGIANLAPKAARKVDDDLYRAIDIYLKAHPNLDEIEREKVCSAMDPLKLSYEARVHASQNKRLPLQITLHALYYDQLKLRSGPDQGHNTKEASTTRAQIQADVSLIKENEDLRAELLRMKMLVTEVHQGKNQQGSSSSATKGGGGGARRPTFFSSVSKKLGKLNPFKNGSKDTSNIEDGVDVTKPKKRRFSIS
ncbi:hypothetical protein RHSIM_Rhsim01G0244300 [Rhododendron simsii]|uniref:Root phototropism protein 2 n=1 Tax=Rhododendron simsii TaxID=118357 RepID=A0A834LZ30_RHOSS|nr:hypothetical protein RHSIM_Rhsim01G0244300 [Rhododendron simsii]